MQMMCYRKYSLLLIKSFLNTIFFSVWPEFSIAYGEKDRSRMKSLINKAVKTSTVIAALICIGLLLLGPWLYKVWTQGHIIFSYSLMIAFLVELICNVLWNIKSVALVSTNNHSQLGLLFVGGSLMALLLSFPIADTLHSMTAITYCLLIMDVPLIIYVNHKVTKLLNLA